MHAFASDPTRGLFILIYLLIVIGGALTLYAMRASSVVSTHRYKLFSREVLLFINNVLLVVALVVVLLGTLLPLVHKEIGLGSISIGAPFFNQIASIWFIPFSLVLGIAPFIRWKQDKLSRHHKTLFVGGILTVLLALTFYLALAIDDLLTLTGIVLASWVACLTALEVVKSKSITKLSLSHWGMVFGHLGFAVLVIGISVTQFSSVEKNLRMKPGEVAEINGYQFKFESVDLVKGPNYSAYMGEFEVTKGSSQVHLHAEKRYYKVQSNVMTEAGIDAGLWRDLYVALGESLDDGSWGIRLYVKPFVRWIWLGGILMMVAGICCLADPRYRRILSAKVSSDKVSPEKVKESGS